MVRRIPSSLCPACREWVGGDALSCPHCQEPLAVPDPYWLASYERLRHPSGPGWPDTTEEGVLTVLSSLTCFAFGMAILLLVAGPFTCFVSWVFAYDLILYGAPLYLLTAVAGFVCLFRHPDAVAGAAVAFAITFGTLGTLLSCLAWYAFGFR